ncbi:DnaJ domain-containing protein [Anabaena sp. FACHB-1237]|uniref:J domain-containing protein n=1 Tax=Anabaena sp. FACHB-1237 TaxID=2692769 RepID=UPI0016802D17|nr:DnaJ domain-containing protein [Anabaena sp. FACHB-1237]MBD2138171.1 DnaJ domain-containing protein [Anabaena sp. FACHB-1237]
MSDNILTKQWLNLLADPYAVLGVSVNAHDRQINKRYHILAKQLHPDHYVHTNPEDQELARLVFTQLINPAHEQIKHSNKRLNTIAKLRAQSIAVDTNQPVGIQMSIIQSMATMTGTEAQLFYEDAIKSYSNAQYHSLYQSYQVTEQLHAINMVYLSFHTEDNQYSDQQKPITPEREKTIINQHSGNISQTNTSSDSINYAHKHYERAVQYTKQKQWNLATLELRDAIKLEPGNSDYYALLGVVYLEQQFVAMAKVYIRQALKLNPQDKLAIRQARILQIEDNNKTNGKSLSIASLLKKIQGK